MSGEAEADEEEEEPSSVARNGGARLKKAVKRLQKEKITLPKAFLKELAKISEDLGRDFARKARYSIVRYNSSK